MYVDIFKRDNGYYDEDNCFYETVEDFICTGIFNFCGCGNPDAAMDYVRQALQLISDLTNKVHEGKMTFEEWDAENDKLFGSTGAKYFLWYWFDKKELTEHGGCVPGWLTEYGNNILSDLQEIHKNRNNEIELPTA